MRVRLFSATVLVALVTMVILVAPASAVLDGQKDVGNIYSNVGMIAADFGDGVLVQIGSCTLVDKGVVLTAAHNVDLGVGADAFRVSFEVNPTPDNPASDTYYAVDRFEIIPGYQSDSLAGIKDDSKRYLRRDDVALVWLEEAPDIAPATIVGSAGLNTLDLKRTRFTVVGYGTTEIVSGSLMSWRNPNTQLLFDGRNYKEVRVINDSEVYHERYLKTSSATAFGDSGGPTFYRGTVVADTVWGESMRAASPGYQYRLDSPAAQAFLRTYLPADRFVSLQ